jgi:hypothetical protein
MMSRRLFPPFLAAALGVALGLVAALPAQAQFQDPSRLIHYPYFYYPHNYWPSLSPQYPEPLGAPYRRPPAYMAYPPYLEAGWRYELWVPQSYYRGAHFWLDQF